MKEKWKPVQGFEGIYEVSNLGRVKALPFTIIGVNITEYRKTGKIVFNKEMKHTERILKPCMDACRLLPL